MKRFLTTLALLICSTGALGESRSAKTLLIPFTLTNATGSEWIADSVAESLRADLRNASISHAGPTALEDSAAIARMAQNAGADYVVGGNVQVVGEQVRITATVVDRSGASIGSAKVTGESRKLFDLEDGLADQIRDDISASRARQHVLTTPVPTVQSSGPIRVAQQPSVPLGTVPVQYSSSALRDGRDRYIYQVPVYGCYGEYGFGAWGCYGLGGFCCGRGGVLDGGYSTGGTHSLAW